MQHLEVVIEHQTVRAADCQPRMRRHNLRSVEHVDGLDPETDIEPATGVAGRDRVPDLTDAHPGLRINPTRQHARRVEPLARQHLQLDGFELEVISNRDPACSHMTAIINRADDIEAIVERSDRRDMWDRDEGLATPTTDLSLDTALLVRALLTRTQKNESNP